MKVQKNFIAVTIGMMLVAFASGLATAEEKTITGTINDSQQLVGYDGRVYEIADTAKGGELVGLSGEKVKVTGEVTESDGIMTIDVIDFEIMQ